jgi:hypothetical protein
MPHGKRSDRDTSVKWRLAVRSPEEANTLRIHRTTQGTPVGECEPGDLTSSPQAGLFSIGAKVTPQSEGRSAAAYGLRSKQRGKRAIRYQSGCCLNQSSI